MKTGWQSKPLEDCIEKVTYTTKIQRKDFLDSGAFPVVSQEDAFISGYWDAEDDVFRVEKPLVIFGDHTRVLKYIDFDFVLGADGVKLLPPKSFLAPKFLYYQLHTAQLDSLGYARHYKLLKELNIKYPCIAEQHRLVAILDEAFDGISTAKANAEKNLQNVQNLFLSGYATAFAQSLFDGYERLTVADMAMPVKGSMRTGPFGSQLLHSEFVDQGIAVLGIDNAVNNEFRWDKRRYITEEKYRQLSRYQVKPGDVLITIMGTCGRCAVVPDDIPVAINTKHLCCITLDPEKCSSGFLHGYFLYHPEAQQFLASRAQGSIMAGLNMGIISELPVLLPPLKQQHALVSKIATLRAETQRLESIYQQKLAALDELKQSLLHQAFSGNL